jgi:hypothetical protein
VTFLAKLNNKETYFKNSSEMGLINLILCSTGDAPTPLNYCKVSGGNGYKALTRKTQK